jgi:hypothetical protein
MTKLLREHNIPLTSNKGALQGRKFEESKEQKVKKKKVELVTNSLILGHNFLRNLKGFHDILDRVMYNYEKLGNIHKKHI